MRKIQKYKINRNKSILDIPVIFGAKYCRCESFWKRKSPILWKNLQEAFGTLYSFGKSGAFLFADILVNCHLVALGKFTQRLLSFFNRFTETLVLMYDSSLQYFDSHVQVVQVARRKRRDVFMYDYVLADYFEIY